MTNMLHPFVIFCVTAGFLLHLAEWHVERHIQRLEALSKYEPTMVLKVGFSKWMMIMFAVLWFVTPHPAAHLLPLIPKYIFTTAMVLLVSTLVRGAVSTYREFRMGEIPYLMRYGNSNGMLVPPLMLFGLVMFMGLFVSVVLSPWL